MTTLTSRSLCDALRRALFGVALVVLPAVGGAAGPDGNWSQLPRPLPPGGPPSPRMYHAAVFDPLGHRMVVFGGHPTFRNDTWSLDLSGAGGGWTPLLPGGILPSPRWGHEAIYDAVRARLVTMGGFGGSSNLADVHALALTGAPTWSDLTPAVPGPAGRRDHLLVHDSLRDRLVVFGGYADTGFVADVWALNLSGTPVWSPVLPAAPGPSPRSMVSGVYDPAGDRIVFHGGWVGDRFSDEVWELALAGTPEWTLLSPAGTGPGPRRDHVAVLDAPNRRIVFHGGFDGKFPGDSWALSLDPAPAWTPLSPSGTPPPGRTSHSVVFDASTHRMVIFGGYNFAYLDDSWSLDLDAGAEAWSRVPGAPPPPVWPSERRDYASVLDPLRNRGVYFGGFNGDYLGDTWLLPLGPSPAWQPLAVAAGPSGRHSASAIFDGAGDRMMVFGGYDLAYRNDLWALEFSGIPAWTPIVPAGTPPDPRMYHSAIEDPVRHRMLVFGGHPAFLNDLWQLNLVGPPVWTRLLSGLGTAPSPRWGHSAIYDSRRDRMIVFGGIDVTGDLNDLWSLSLSGTPVWTQVFATGTPPSPRRNFAMTCDPGRDRVLVFGGGSDALGLFNDVWELTFTPSARWTRLAPGGATISPRDLITAPYEPGMDRLVVFGGWNHQYLSDVWFLSFDMPTAVRISSVRAQAGSGGVSLAWRLSGDPAERATVERSADGVEWSAIAEVGLAADGEVAWYDRDASPGSHTGYRLAVASVGGVTRGGEVWVDAPAAGRFGIRSIGPNPGGDAVTLEFSLASHQHVGVELLDLQGRRIEARPLGVLAAGVHRARLAPGHALAAGIYLVRLRAGAEVATGKWMVVR